MRAWYFALILIVAAIAGTGGYLASGSFQGGSGDAQEGLRALDAQGASLIGQQSPDYRLADTNGNWIESADFEGRVVLLNFWATWCKPCREEMPMLADLREGIKSRGFEVVGIAIDDVASARAFVEDLGIQYPNLVGATDVMGVMAAFGNAEGMLPYSVLVGSRGIVQWAHFGALEEDALRHEIDKLLTKD